MMAGQRLWVQAALILGGLASAVMLAAILVEGFSSTKLMEVMTIPFCYFYFRLLPRSMLVRVGIALNPLLARADALCQDQSGLTGDPADKAHFASADLGFQAGRGREDEVTSGPPCRRRARRNRSQ